MSVIVYDLRTQKFKFVAHARTNWDHIKCISLGSQGAHIKICHHQSWANWTKLTKDFVTLKSLQKVGKDLGHFPYQSAHRKSMTMI